MNIEYFEFSLSNEAFYLKCADQNIEIKQGLSFIAAQSLKQGNFNALAIEHAIYVIEEILEQSHLEYAVQRIGKSKDAELQQLFSLFFNDQVKVDRFALEHAFNEFIERVEYYQNKVDVPNQALFLYFIFMREMMHHLNVIEIHFLEVQSSYNQ